MKETNYAKITSWLLAVWFAFSLAASAFHLYRNVPPQPPIALLFAVLTPVVVFAVWYQASKPFREFVLSLNPRILTLVHTWRVGGFVFLVLYSYGILPGIFALPAGWGDISIGATAALVAFKLADGVHKKSFILWQVLGMTDLLVAVSLGATTQFINPQQLGSSVGITTAPMTVLPLSLIPTFAVPLLFILHLICIAQARRWAGSAYKQVEPAASLAA